MKVKVKVKVMVKVKVKVGSFKSNTTALRQHSQRMDTKSLAANGK